MRECDWFSASLCHVMERFHLRGQQPCKCLEPKKVFTREKSSTPTGLVWYINMAAAMAAVTPCENTLLADDNLVYTQIVIGYKKLDTYAIRASTTRALYLTS